MKRANFMATASGPACSRGSAYTLGRLFVATVAVLLFSLVICRPAYALSTNPGVEINGWSLTAFGMDGEEGYLVYAPDKYSAAAMALGYSWDDVKKFTDDQKSYMSNESTGGDFYVFASNFEKLNANTPAYGDVPYAWAMGYLTSNQVIWGGRVYTDAWAVNTTRDMRSDALQKLEGILNGDVGGDDPTPPTQDGDWVILSFPLWYGSNTDTNRYYFVVNSTRFYFNSTSPQMHSPVYVRIKKTAFDALTSHDGWFIGLYPAGTTSTLHLYLGYVEQGSLEWTAGQNDSTMRYFKFSGSEDTNAVWYENVYSLNLYSTNDDVLTLYRDVSSFSLSRQSGRQTWSSSPVYAVLGGVSGGTPVPPTTWPDPPENPTVDPPTVPEPPTGPVVEPPTIPTQPTPVYPTPPVVYEPTVPATPDLSDILDALNEHCIHLQDAIHREAENIDTDMREQIGWLAGVFSDTIESLDGDIELYFNHLEGYLYDLFHWLADQFDFSFGEYDDSSVLYWLRMIYSKLGRGGPTTRPTDPVTDPFGIGDWIKQLIDNFLLDLIAIGAGDLADVIADFRDLARKFPFSVPWDLAAMLALLVAQPVTPVIDFPWYSFTANGLVSTTVHMDLSAWNATMEPIRLMEKLAFCMLLASRSKDLLDFIRLGRGDA